jgi:hypothetical protein
MGLLPRISKIALAVTLLLALTSLPALRTNRILGSALTPVLAWAGGSPDETLAPEPAPPPPKKASSIEPTIAADSNSGTQNLGAAFGRLKGADRWELLVRIYFMTVLRF